MASWIIADRVRDVFTGTGTGAATVSGTAPTGYRTFSAVCAVGDYFPAFIQHETAAEWEVGLYTYTGTNQITRTVVLNGSSGVGTAVSFSAGNKFLVLDQLAVLYGAVTPQPDGTLSSGSNIGRISFSTQTSGSTSFTERMRIDSAGLIMLGGGAAVPSIAGATANVQMNLNSAVFAVHRFSADASAPIIFFAKSRSGTIGTHSIVSADDGVLQINGGGSDGTSFLSAIRISGFIDGTPSSNSIPGRIVFHTAASGAGALTERLRIDSNGYVCIETGGTGIGGF